MTTNNNKKVFGIIGFAAIAAVLTLGMVAVSLQSQLAEAEAANKGGFVFDDIQMKVNPVMSNNGTLSEAIPIAYYHWKSSNYNEFGANLILECATANHIQGKGKMSSFEGAQTGVKVFFTHWYDDGNGGTERVLYLDGTESDTEFDPEAGDYENNVLDKAKWNVCSQVFEIKTQLNALIEEDTEDRDGDLDTTELIFACEEDPITGEIPDTTECQQYVELFLETAGTHPAKVFLNNVPHGDNAVKVYVEVNASSQEGLENDRTSVAIGKVMLDIYPRIADNNNSLN